MVVLNAFLLTGCPSGNLDVNYLSSTGTLTITGSKQVIPGTCNSYTANYQDSNITNPSEISSAAIGLSGNLQFYSDSDCTQPVTSVLLPSGATSATFYAKYASSANTTSTTPDENPTVTLQAQLPSGTTGTLAISVVSGTADHLKILKDPSSGAAGATVILGVQILDRFENPVQGVPLTFTLESGTGSISNPNGVSDSRGNVETAVTLGRVANIPTIISATSPNPLPNFAATGSTTLKFTEMVMPGSADHMKVANDPGIGVVGSPLILGVKVFDQFENAVQGVPLNFAITHGQGSISNSIVSSSSTGLAQTTFTLGTQTSQNPNTVSVTSVQALPNLAQTGSSSLTFTEIATPDSPSRMYSNLTLSPSAQVITGSEVEVIISLKDEYLNPIANFLPQLTSTVTGTSINQPQLPTDNNGQTTGSFIATQIPTHLVSLSSPAFSPALSASITVTQDNPSLLAFSASSLSGGSQYSCHTITILTEDGSGNLKTLQTPQALSVSSPSSSAHFYTDSACSITGNSFTMSSGSSSYTFSYIDNLPEFLNLTLAPSTGPITGTLNGTIPIHTSLSLWGSGTYPSTGPVNTCLGPFYIGSNTVISASNPTTVNLSYNTQTGASFNFYSDSGCNASITSVSIPAQALTASFYFKTNNAETASFSAAIPSNLPASQIFLSTNLSYTVFAQLGLVMPNSGVGQVASCIGPFQVTSPQIISDTSSTNINLSLTSQLNAIYGFYSNSGCNTTLTSVAIPAQQYNSAQFYLKSNRAETVLLRASMNASSGLFQDATNNFIFSPIDVLSQFLITGPSILSVNTCTPIKITAADQGNNILSTSAINSNVVINLSGNANSSGNYSSFYSDNSCQYSTNQATITHSTNSTTVYLKYSGISYPTNIPLAQTLTATYGSMSSNFPFVVFNTGSTLPTGSLSVGGKHLCAIGNGTLKCLGSNQYGQLGTGDTFDRLMPFTTYSGATAIINVSSGASHSCAVNQAGSIYCWGDNSYLQVGYGTSNKVLSPTQVSIGGATASQVIAGAYHTCAMIYSSGTNSLQCWGNNSSGQLGSGSYSSTNNPTSVSGMTAGVISAAAGMNFTCAIQSGNVSCWGANNYGQLGINGGSGSPTPVAISGLSSGFTQVAAGGDFVCALNSSGNVYCWGRNDNGNLGDGGTCGSICNQPVLVVDQYSNTALTGAIAITAGQNHACALINGGAVKCWGSSNLFGQLGNGTTSSQAKADSISLGGASFNFTAVSSNLGGNSTCASASSGEILCWGQNDAGQLGLGGYLSPTMNFASIPQPIISLLQ